jgi:uncharacterized protein YceH (UPF0502 family)
MGIALDPTERRVVGTLVEKEATVPEAYPLTVNALLLGCNQRSNRDPETSYPEHEVDGAVRSLMERGWVLEHEKAGGRTRRYAHRAREQLGVDDADLAILAELWLRGPQSAPELEKRAARMRPVGDLAAVEARLNALASRPVPYVRFLGKRAGERVPRWEHLFGTDGERAAGNAPSSPPQRPGTDVVRSVEVVSLDPLALAARIDRLEADVAALRAEVARLSTPPTEDEERETT